MSSQSPRRGERLSEADKVEWHAYCMRINPKITRAQSDTLARALLQLKLTRERKKQ